MLLLDPLFEIGKENLFYFLKECSPVKRKRDSKNSKSGKKESLF